MGLMNAIGLQPRNPTTSVTSQGTQTLAPYADRWCWERDTAARAGTPPTATALSASLDRNVTSLIWATC
ncbi:hypothetical protein Celaphus_00009359 [Cervus elaphus hippelaphus]|uniref:Uncharacterized protein n=1 Tax=Cervus elaphus hippelaphus TaxID=46360 RepID=A0A212DIC3_CEREH|nr:hypothetical protein Celaphus_00009359 [Cervus elaphus hippelaphus]